MRLWEGEEVVQRGREGPRPRAPSWRGTWREEEGRQGRGEGEDEGGETSRKEEEKEGWLACKPP
jgi:hypothetical protein